MHSEEVAISDFEHVLKRSGEPLHIFFISKNSPCQYRGEGERKPCLNILKEKSHQWKKYGHLVFVGYYRKWGDGYRKEFDPRNATDECKNLDQFKNDLKFKINISEEGRNEIWKLFKDVNLPTDDRNQIKEKIKNLFKMISNITATFNEHHSRLKSDSMKNTFVSHSLKSCSDFMEEVFQKILLESKDVIKKNFVKVSKKKFQEKQNEKKVDFIEINSTTPILCLIPE